MKSKNKGILIRVKDNFHFKFMRRSKRIQLDILDYYETAIYK